MAGDRPASSPEAALESPPDAALLLAQLAGGLAHEIKNPLSTMAINLTLLQEEWERQTAEEPHVKRSLRRLRSLQSEVARLESILEEFLKYARGGKVNRRPDDLSRIVRDLVEFVEPENERAGIRQHADLQPSIPLVNVDETQIKQAILNEVAAQGWITHGTLNVIVAGGVVELWGWVDTEKERHALMLLARGIDGVQSVVDHLGSVPPYQQAI